MYALALSLSHSFSSFLGHPSFLLIIHSLHHASFSYHIFTHPVIHYPVSNPFNFPPVSLLRLCSLLSHHPLLAPPPHPPTIPFPIHPLTLFSVSSPPRLPCYLPQLLNYYGRFSGDNLGTKCLPGGTRGSSYQVEAKG